MRHSLYCSCHRCNAEAPDQQVNQRQKHYANGTTPPLRQPAPVPLTQGISEESLNALREHFNRR